MREEEVIRHILTTSSVIATVGLSANPAKTSHGIAQYLIDRGYEVIPVNPGADEILGRKAYPDLNSIPRKVDVVQIFRPSEDVPPIVDQAVQIGAKAVWMQAGIFNLLAAEAARAAGLLVVMDRCMRQEHIRLFSHLMSS